MLAVLRSVRKGGATGLAMEARLRFLGKEDSVSELARTRQMVELGTTTGRRCMDRHHRRHGAAPKRLFVRPLVGGARRRLREA